MSGAPEDRSLLSNTTQGSKSATPRRLPLRTSGSSVSRAAVRQFQRGRLRDLRQQRTDAHIQPGLAQDARQLLQVLQIELVARVVFRNQQHAARFRADLFHRALHGMHAQRNESPD